MLAAPHHRAPGQGCARPVHVAVLSAVAACAAGVDNPTIAPSPTPESPGGWCEQHRPFIRRLNMLAYARSATGAVAVLLCGAVALHIWAYRRDVRSLSTRLVLGVITANFVFAATDARIPPAC